MARAKKPAEVKYGIEITKPHSQEMYDHNDMVATEMKTNILNKWNELLKEFAEFDMDTPWDIISDDSDIVKLQKLVCFSGYGSGYTISNVDKEFRNELDMMQNYSIHQEYSYGCFSGLLPRTKFMMLGMEVRSLITMRLMILKVKFLLLVMNLFLVLRSWIWRWLTSQKTYNRVVYIN